MKNVLLILTLLLCKQLCAQEFEDSLSRNKKIWIKTTHFAGYKSTSIENGFAGEFYKGGYLDEKLRINQSEKNEPINRLGFDLNSGVEVWFNTEKVLPFKGFYIGVRYAERLYLASHFSSDLFHVFFLGNNDFEGKTAQMDGFIYKQLRYRQAGLGIKKYFDSDKGSHSIQLNLNYNRGLSARMIDFPVASLNTAYLGESLSLDIDGTYRLSDTSLVHNKNYLRKGGEGISADLAYTFISKNGQSVSIQVKDAGYIFWYPTSLKYDKDTTLNFNGFTIPDIFNVNDSLVQMSFDSLDRAANKSTNQSFTTLLPAFLQLNYCAPLPVKNMVGLVDFSYRTDHIYLPLGLAGLGYTFCKSHFVSLKTGYGGYGKLNVQATYNFHWKNNLNAMLQITQTEGLLMMRKGTGAGLRFNLLYMF